jgi:hypothetical protein
MKCIYAIISALSIGNAIGHVYLPKQSVTIILKNNIKTSNKTVYLYDLAMVDTIIKNVDIIELKPSQNSIMISKKHILMRLILYDNSYKYDIIGPDYIEVKYVNNYHNNKLTVIPGRKVALFYRHNGIELKTTAELIEVGKIGELVKLRINDTSKIVTALLIDENSAIIE